MGVPSSTARQMTSIGTLRTAMQPWVWSMYCISQPSQPQPFTWPPENCRGCAVAGGQAG